MNEKAVRSIWTAVGLALAYLSFNAWSATQQWGFELPGLSFENYKSFPASIFGLLGGVPLLILEVYLASHHPKPKKSIWSQRLPIAFGQEIDVTTTLGRRYQAFFVFLFILFPSFAQVHFIDKFWTGCFRHDQGCLTPIPFSDLCSNNHSYFGVTFFPIYEPVLLTILSTGAVCLALFQLWQIFIRSNDPNESEKPEE
ncbi:MAG: hypothetical protein ACQGVK_22295 [Myxococcota bacterium]